MELSDISQLPTDARHGDLVRIHLSGEKNSLIGYVWYTSEAEYEAHENDSEEQLDTRLQMQATIGKMKELGAPKKICRFLEQLMRPPYDTTLTTEHANIYLSSISPEGIDKTLSGDTADYNLESLVQLFGIDTERKLFLTAPIIGYDILERAP